RHPPGEGKADCAHSLTRLAVAAFRCPGISSPRSVFAPCPLAAALRPEYHAAKACPFSRGFVSKEVAVKRILLVCVVLVGFAAFAWAADDATLVQTLAKQLNVTD